MKILLTHRFFWPDTAPYAIMLRSIGDGLADAGHNVSVYSSVPSYRVVADAPRSEMLGQLHITRGFAFPEKGRNILYRIANLLLYCFGLFWHIVKTRPDVVSASTFPPVLAGWVASLAARLVGADFIYHLQDVHPEVSKFSGGFLGRGLAFKLLAFLDNQTLRRSTAVIILSEDMAETVRARAGNSLPIHIINNFMLDNFSGHVAPPAGLAKPTGMKRIIFAGNIGRFQNLPVLVEGVAEFLKRRTDADLLMLGSGDALPLLQERWKEHPRIRFSPFIPFAEAQSVIAECDVGLVSLIENVYRVSFPSKLVSYLGMGVPVLAMLEPHSNLAQLVRSAKLGKVPASDKPEDIARALEEILDMADTKSGIATWYDANVSRSIAVESWCSIVAKMAPSRKTAARV